MAHEFSLQDVEILQQTGNAVINRIFEAELTRDDFDKKYVDKDEDEENKRRGRFIKYKYKKQKYVNDILFRELVAQLLQEPKVEDDRRPTHK